VVDIACGEGFYSRLLRQYGARKVVGIDLSERMIELARAQEAEHRLGIDYTVGDGRELAQGEEYDLAVAAYLLNYARDRHELGAMCNSIARCLGPAGRFVTVNCNPAFGLPKRTILSQIRIRIERRQRSSRRVTDYLDIFLRKRPARRRHLCCLKNESEGLGTPM